MSIQVQCDKVKFSNMRQWFNKFDFGYGEYFQHKILTIVLLFDKLKKSIGSGIIRLNRYWKNPELQKGFLK